MTATLFPADKVPFDFRKAMPVWQVALADGTHVYVGQHSGKIEAMRTRWWRAFDFMWGLHILDPQTREDTSHPLLILACGAQRDRRAARLRAVVPAAAPRVTELTAAASLAERGSWRCTHA